MKRLFIAGLFVVAAAAIGASAADQGAPGRGGPGQAAPAPAGRGQAPDGGAGGPAAARGGGGGGFAKRPGQLASGWNASSTVARTTLRHEWVDIGSGANKVRTWIEYPEGDARAPVVIVMSYEAGLDDWIRSVADELATSGFIALAPDLLTGLGPNGGNYDAFRSPDEAILATRNRVTADRAMRQYLAAAEYGAKLPRANGKTASVGFGPGGTFSFRFAAEAPAVNAAVVFYGPAPSDAILRQVKVSILGFYGEDDPPITGTVEATAATLKGAGKRFDYQIYPGATHHFGLIQVEGRNGPAVQDAWARTLAFFKEHLQ